MRIAIIDADLIGRRNYRFPNLASMKLAGYHKERDDNVMLITGYSLLFDAGGGLLFDRVFISKVFTDTPVPDALLTLPNAEGVFEDDLIQCLLPLFLEKFGSDGLLDIKKLLIGLKTVQDFDNVESQRLVLKRRISAATGEEKEKLAGLLDTQEHLWLLLETDRQYRANAIDWLKGMEDRRADTGQLMATLDAALLRAWFVEGTIDGDKLTALWLDGTTTESTITRTGKRKPSFHNIRNTSKGEF